MQFRQHWASPKQKAIWEAEHFVDGVHVRAIIHDRDPVHARTRAAQVYADLEAGAARRAKGEDVPEVVPHYFHAYGPAGHAEHADGVWYGAAMINGVSHSLTVPAPTHDEGFAALTRMFSDLAAGETPKHAAAYDARRKPANI